MPRIILLLLGAVLTLSACTRPSTVYRVNTTQVQSIRSALQDIPGSDVISWGDRVHDAVEEGVRKAADDIGGGKRTLTLTGAVVTAVGSLGALLSGAVDEEDAKWVGIGAGAVTIGLGIVQSVAGGKVDATSCAQAFIRLNGDWLVADKATDAAAKAAFASFIQGVTEARNRCLGIIDITLPRRPVPIPLPL